MLRGAAPPRRLGEGGYHLKVEQYMRIRMRGSLCWGYSNQWSHHFDGCGVRTLNSKGPQEGCVRAWKYQGPQKTGVLTLNSVHVAIGILVGLALKVRLSQARGTLNMEPHVYARHA